MAFQRAFGRTMVLRSLVLICVILVTSCSQPEQGKSESEPEPNVGKELFEQSCTACHGYDGKAGVGGANDLTISTLNPEEIEDVIKNGRKTMVAQPYAYSNDEELKELIDYVLSLRE